MLLPEEVADLERMSFRGWKTKVLDGTWPASEGPGGLEEALERISSEASKAIDEGFQYLVISDRASGAQLMVSNYSGRMGLQACLETWVASLSIG